MARRIADRDQIPQRRDLDACTAIAGAAALPLCCAGPPPCHRNLQVLIKSIFQVPTKCIVPCNSRMMLMINDEMLSAGHGVLHQRPPGQK